MFFLSCREWTFATIRSRKSSSSSKISSSNTPKDSSPCNEKNKNTFMSKKVFCVVLITNLVSFLIGAGIGIWLSKKGVNEELIEIAV